ncbi:hypothetical protein, partial [Nonomuraea sp. K271]|uniref:hypothetical protein n=1 Tax=Nonomuraea sp. K271 TaxID=1848319 RepID=UPI00191C65D5
SSLVSLGDVNKDGRTDIGAVDLDGVLHIWNGKGDNKFTPADRTADRTADRRHHSPRRHRPVGHGRLRP